MSEEDIGSAMSEDIDPFSEESLRISSFIMQCRIYDVLMGLLKETNADLARDLLELHMGGSLMGTAPSFNGQFLTDLMNNTPEESEEE